MTTTQILEKSFRKQGLSVYDLNTKVLTAVIDAVDTAKTMDCGGKCSRYTCMKKAAQDLSEHIKSL
jgi:hypothetical protein